MARAFFFGTPAHGHVNPTLGVVRELIARGETVVYFATEEFRAKIEAAGAEFRGYESVVPDADGAQFTFTAQQAGNIFSMAALVMEKTLRVMPGLIELTGRDRPDYILHDAISVWGKHLAWRLGVPAVSSISTMAFNFWIGAASPRFQWEIARMAAEDPGGLPRFLSLRRAFRRNFGGPRSGLLDIFANEEDLVLVYTSRLFQPMAGMFNKRYRFVGPTISPRASADTPGFPWDRLDGRRVLYISMGTIFHEVTEFYHHCFEAFADWDGAVVLSAGVKTDLSRLGIAPDNFVVSNFVPQVPLLGRAAAFITHAGMNSTSEGLYHGVPLVTIPQGADQFTVAERVQRLRAGLQLHRGHITPARLRRAVERITGDASYARHATQIGDSFREAGGAPRAADEVLRYVEARRA
jgi:MGT family glycosyltransferase